ncbi:hypothetical protein AB0K51_19245 [Kitasatospora sp. NPDC049285]|uniref:hypothetical protein n=1 Tax=Kitasatospora sp. NPDC049285 TaxID=3157096 RepID=UPI003448A139
MFENLTTLPPETAARRTALVEECRPVLAAEGMEATQALLAERGTSIVAAIAITRALFAPAGIPLPVAQEIVLSSAARAATA